MRPHLGHRRPLQHAALLLLGQTHHKRHAALQQQACKHAGLQRWRQKAKCCCVPAAVSSHQLKPCDCIACHAADVAVGAAASGCVDGAVTCCIWQQRPGRRQPLPAINRAVQDRPTSQPGIDRRSHLEPGFRHRTLSKGQQPPEVGTGAQQDGGFLQQGCVSRRDSRLQQGLVPAGPPLACACHVVPMPHVTPGRASIKYKHKCSTIKEGLARHTSMHCQEEGMPAPVTESRVRTTTL